MKDRLKEIVSALPQCRTLADVGCDHGYAAQAALAQNKCERVILADVSEKCLDKARRLLKNEIADGRASAFVSDGFDALPPCDAGLIAGMGGEEIIKILDNALKNDRLPEFLLLQPMKNPQKLREKLVACGYEIVKDYVFYVKNKYYVLISARRGEDVLTEEEKEFGRTNVRELPPDFIRFIREELDKLYAFSCGMAASRKHGGNENPESGNLLPPDAHSISEKIKRYERYVKN